MGQIWGAAKRGEGYDLARDHEGFTWALIIILSTAHGLFRWFAGRPLGGDQHRSTYATFLKGGDKPLNPKHRPPGRWSYLPEWKRSVIRQGCLIVLIAGLWAYAPFGFWGGGLWEGGVFHTSVHNSVTITASAIIGITLWLLIIHTDAKVRNIRHNTGFVRPLKRRVAALFDNHPSTITGHFPNTRRGSKP